MTQTQTMTTPVTHADAAARPTRHAAFDSQRHEAFAERFVNMLNEAGLMLMISIGHRTGLFDAMADAPPASSEQIADAAGLQERYVREWLGAMVAGRVVDYDPTRRTYQLPAEHAAWLIRDAAPNNLAAAAQWFAVLGSVETQIVEKFRHGGGVHYHCYHRFHETMAEESAQTVVAALDEHILPLVPGLRQQLEAGIDVLDIGCGSGLAACKLAEMFPRSRFTGYDLCEDAIAAARREAQRRELTNIRFEARDVTDLGARHRFDLITGFDVIHDQKAPAAVLDQVYAALKPDGIFLMQDINASSRVEKNIDHPAGAFLYTISTMHCMTVSLAQNGAGLGTCWGEELAIRMLAEAGFDHVKVHKLQHDFMNNFYVARPTQG